MLDQTIRTSILALRDAGHGTRSIARALGISRGTVKAVLADGRAAPPAIARDQKCETLRDDIIALYSSCKGNLVRVHEELLAQHPISLSYPALTAFCRREGIGHEAPTPTGHYTFEPGQEMQHDTSPHDVHIGGAVRRVQTASLVLAHSRMVFMQLYPRFTRFHCIKWMTRDQMIDEATGAYPGVAAIVRGFLPVSICLEGSGDPYFLRLEDGAVVRIPHDAVIDDVLDMNRVEHVSSSVERLIKAAEVFGPTAKAGQR